MIKRILNPDDVIVLMNDIFILFELENSSEDLSFIKYDKETMINSFANKHLLAWDYYIWANHNGKNYDAIIIFLNEKSIFFNKKIFSELIWLSKNKKIGHKLFKEACNFAIEKNFEYITMKTCMTNKNSYSVSQFYEKKGLIKTQEIYTAIL
jgi:hypothetical protein